MKQTQSFAKLFFLLFVCIYLTACGAWGPDSQIDDEHPPLDFSFDTYMPLALGGVAQGWNQIQIDSLSEGDRVELVVRPYDLVAWRLIQDNSDSITYEISPLKAGIGQLTYEINGVEQAEVIKIVVPPQEMIQILLGEARSIIPQEVFIDGTGQVEKDSVSPTATALLNVVRNRIQIMQDEDAPHLFVVDRDDFDAADAAELYRLVIEAHGGSVYQFSPVKPEDPSHDAYLAGADREGLSGNRLLTYDQGVLTAAGIFDESIADNTDLSFGFYSPTKAQFENLLGGLGSNTLPSNIGTSDAQFPALSPIQIRILNDISPQAFDEELPSFVFVGERNPGEDAVVEW